jgi:hypothetical protein
MQAWGSGAAMPPPNFVVPNVAFAEQYAHLPQPHQGVAIIATYVARNMQNIAAIQTNANQMGEGNENNAFGLGRLHLAPSEKFIGGAVPSYYEQGYNNQDYQYQPPAEDEGEEKHDLLCLIFLFPFSFTLIFSLCAPMYA